MKRSISLILFGLSMVAGTAWSGPLFDPFLERFQVGTYRDPTEIHLVDGYPADLLEPVRVDTDWTGAARRVLTSFETEGRAFLTPLLLHQQKDPAAATAWLDHMSSAIDDLESGSLSENWEQAPGNLGAALGSRAVFRHLAAGRNFQAAAMAIRLRDNGRDLGMSDREIFVWDLRAKLLFRLAGNKTNSAGSSWPTMLDLGSFDRGSAWAIWVAHRRKAGDDLLPAVMTSEEWGRHLSGISRSWLTPGELYDSGFSADFQSGLGAVMFKGAQRDQHFLKFPEPPTDNALQGLWVRGRRLQSGGAPGVYEDMAREGHLKPGWKMDVWRRASEKRLLNDQWEPGLEDLRQALILAADGQGHWTTRRRLRQWNEQALVLALAKNDLATARKLHDMGQDYFKDKDLEAFLKETDHWAHLLDPLLDPDVDRPQSDQEGIEARSRSMVETGKVADLGASDESRRDLFHLACDRSSGDLWDLWVQWGLTLANPAPVQGLKKERAIAYQGALKKMDSGTEPDLVIAGALALVVDRLGERPVFEQMLAQAFDRDVQLACNWVVPPEPSTVPDLLPRLSGSELDRHALLGFALAAGDMRGILAVAEPLEGRGLTPDEKRRFLYPLPVEGAIFQAIAEAGSDPALLLAVARNESLFEPSIRSRAGALGWMQIMPFHLEQRGALPGKNNWRNPGVSIKRGDSILLENSRRHQGNPYQAVAAYNAGTESALRWDRQLGGSADRDIYLAWIGYPETRHYVEKVLIDREIYDWIIRDESSR